MFEASLKQVVTLKKIVDLIKDLITEVNIEASPSGLYLQAMDSAHVSLVSLQLNQSGFEHYRCDKSITIGINLTYFSQILKMAQNDDVVTLKADDENSFFTIIFDNKKTEKNAEFQLNLLNLDTESLAIPETDYPTFLKMNSNEFVRICRELTQLAENVKVEVEDNIAVFSFMGKAGAGKIKIKRNSANNEDHVDVKCDEVISNSYSLQYLNSFAKASSLSLQVKLYFSARFPLMLEYEIENMGLVKFFLAPKMDDEATEN